MVHENQEAKEEKRMRNKVFHKNENFMIEIPNTQQTLQMHFFFFFFFVPRKHNTFL